MLKDIIKTIRLVWARLNRKKNSAKMIMDLYEHYIFCYEYDMKATDEFLAALGKVCRNIKPETEKAFNDVYLAFKYDKLKISKRDMKYRRDCLKNSLETMKGHFKDGNYELILPYRKYITNIIPELKEKDLTNKTL